MSKSVIYFRHKCIWELRLVLLRNVITRHKVVWEAFAKQLCLSDCCSSGPSGKDCGFMQSLCTYIDSIVLIQPDNWIRFVTDA